MADALYIVLNDCIKRNFWQIKVNYMQGFCSINDIHAEISPYILPEYFKIINYMLKEYFR